MYSSINLQYQMRTFNTPTQFTEQPHYTSPALQITIVFISNSLDNFV